MSIEVYETMSTATMWLLLFVVAALALLIAALTKTKFTVQKISIIGIMAALSFVAYEFFRIPNVFGTGSSFHLGNTFTALTAMLLDGVSGGLAGAIGLALADVVAGDPGYAITTFILKFIIGLVCGAVSHKVIHLRTFPTGNKLKYVAAVTASAFRCSMVVKILTTAAVFLMIREPGDLLKYCLIMSGGTFINQFLLWFYARKLVGRPVFDGGRVLAHVKPMLILFIPVVAVSLYTMMDKLMLGAMSTNAQMGFYEASERIILCASSVITAFGTVMMPRMTKLFSDGDLRESQRYMKLSVDAIMAIAFAIALGIVSVSRLFAPIFWGEDFAPCAYILSALALSIPFSGFANVIRMQYLIPNGMDGAYILSVILGAVSNLTANSLLIPRCGALGAAVGTVIAEGVVCAAQCLAVKKRIDILAYLKSTAFFGMAGLLMYGAVRVLDQRAEITVSWLLLEIVVGGSVYCILYVLYLYHTKNELLMTALQKLGGAHQNNDRG